MPALFDKRYTAFVLLPGGREAKYDFEDLAPAKHFCADLLNDLDEWSITDNKLDCLVVASASVWEREANKPSE